jgi:hypothetical protein
MRIATNGRRSQNNDRQRQHCDIGALGLYAQERSERIMIAKLVELLLYGSDQVIANWSPAKAQYYEKETLKYLGRGEVAYTWSRQFVTRKAG